MFALLAVVLIATIGLSATTVVVTARDGYRRIPTRHTELSMRQHA
ncbi:hypothetical protein [Marisediminicola antarctica]|nr:hypothetical protein [Marisediminicola antarctica]